MYDITSSPLVKLLQSATKHVLPKGQVMQFSSNRMFINLLTSGYIKRYLLTDEGQESIQVIYGPNDIFPLTPVFDASLGLKIYKGSEVLYYEAHTDAVIYSLGKDEFMKAIKLNEHLYKDLFYVSGVRLESNIQRLENTSLRAAERKIIDLLLFYADKFGTKIDKGIRIELPLTQQVIANILNVARETVSIAIVKMHDKGYIQTEHKHLIVIPDIDLLKKVR